MDRGMNAKVRCRHGVRFAFPALSWYVVAPACSVAEVTLPSF